ncbi:hypothetical protein [Novosphingobium sp. AP12]|uniref:hypothetical protein n=1 Tax=Novosphingobium sp. AP12 TaxID=1144305 RepID=UPI0012F98AF9|nr:hypothetical protein [Novosphingobium sp. AP12]
MFGTVGMLMLAAGSPSAPTYLRCVNTDGEWSLEVEMSLDERGRAATIVMPSLGRVVSRNALFSPEEVRIFDEESVWVIDRVTLDLRRDVTIGDKKSTTSGKCQLKPAPAKRAF